MLLALLFQDLVSLPWDKMLAGAQGILVLAIILIFFLRIAPTWKAVRMRELEVRQAEAVASGQQAESQKAIADVLYKVAIEQRRAADSVKILQHVNSRDLGDFEEQIAAFDDRLGRIEKRAQAA